MKRRNFDLHKFVTISMIVVGVGFFLLSLILPAFLWKSEGLGLDILDENQEMTEARTLLSSSSIVPSEPVNGSESKQYNDQQIDEFTALLKSLEGESGTELARPSEEVSGEKTEDSSASDSSEKVINQEEVEVVVAQIYESAENYRQILIRNKDLDLGLEHLYPEVVHDPEIVNREYFEARSNISGLLGDYVKLTDDFDAFSSGGWVSEAFAGMVEVQASAESRAIVVRFPVFPDIF